jgi:hypothetical protein
MLLLIILFFSITLNLALLFGIARKDAEEEMLTILTKESIN